ncbi:short-chain dehydrogenase/reductase SDR [Gloeophyllum trabeum ATCC 11539]|uniref:Short-chain dehydrogenase/reductase SDR n=1 Tax=Gloeophyllum trabeum (strain ATCC 11539 / FP-39264 / Madison 617) TaxID=670483 RepID=S7Q5P9_GLOTA|nr:short-chain dehydrogenase/reductase SDR [Gloeophyllum trabeum ATCC 11539]EPQ55386.1 short-chain dehydrogenase/reductase SDR [Gloeophyllum trabeum ATCC 11539]
MSGTGRLAGKVALITGAGAGIGLAATKRFLAEGAKVVVADLNITKAQQDPELLRDEYKDSIAFIQGDVTKEADVKASCELPLEKWGKLDIALLNAGLGHPTQPWLTTDESVIDKMLAVNVKGPWFGVKHAVASMIASPHKGKGCSIVLTSSVASTYGEPEFSPYVAAKWAVRGLGLVGAQEFAKYGIRVNTIQPGATNTQLYQDSFPEEVKQAILKTNLMGRPADPMEIANVMLFLASDEASFMTGSTVAVHAGQTPT